MKKKPSIKNTLFLLSFLFLACKDENVEQKDLGDPLIITATKLNIREYAAGYSQSLGFTKKDEIVKRILKTKFPDKVNGLNGNWIYIVTQKGIHGFIFDHYADEIKGKESNNNNFLKNSYEFKEDEYIHSYDLSAKKISVLDFEKLSFLNPYHERFCDTIYAEFVNAETSESKFISDSEESYENYHQIWTKFDWANIPSDLKNMSEYCKGHFEFYDYVHKSLLNFYKTNDLTYLKIKFNKFDPEIQAKSILEIIENQTDQSKRFYIAKFQWHTAMNNQYRNFNGKVDWDAFQKDKENLRNYWDMFLKKQSIKKMKIRFINNDIYKD